MFTKKGQNLAGCAFLIAIVTRRAMTMQVYLKRNIDSETIEAWGEDEDLYTR